MKSIPYHLALILIVVSTILTGCKKTETVDVKTSVETKENNESSSNKGQAYIEDESGNPNALRIAIDSPDHTTLVTAVEAAEVQNALVNVGPLTVFAPTNAAFEKIPKQILEDLLKPENKQKLAYILKNHVAPSNYPIETLRKNVEKGRSLYMASGENVSVTRNGDDIFVGDTKIIASIKVSNGWVHVIEDVILPKTTN